MGNIMSFQESYRVIPIVITKNNLQSLPPVYEISGACPFDYTLYTTGLGDYSHINQNDTQNLLAARIAYMLHARYRPVDNVMEGEEDDDDNGVALLKQIYKDMDSDKLLSLHKRDALSATFLGYTHVSCTRVPTITILVVT